MDGNKESPRIMAVGFRNTIPKKIKVDNIISSPAVPFKLTTWTIVVFSLLIAILVYLLYKSNKCACMPELIDLRDELMDTVVQTDMKLRGDMRREKAEQQEEEKRAQEEMYSMTYASPAYKPQLVNKAPSTHGYDMEDSSSVDEGGNQVTEISELRGDGFTVLDPSIISDVQNGVVDLDGGQSEQWMMPGQGLDPMISTPVVQSRY